MSVFFLTLFNTLAGVRDVDRELIDVIRLMKGGRLRIIGEVMLPSVLVWVFSGLRISAPYALIGAVTGEILTSNRGLGFLVSRNRQRTRYRRHLRRAVRTHHCQRDALHHHRQRRAQGAPLENRGQQELKHEIRTTFPTTTQRGAGESRDEQAHDTLRSRCSYCCCRCFDFRR